MIKVTARGGSTRAGQRSPERSRRRAYTATREWTRALLSNALNLALFTELYTEADEHERESLTAIRTKLDLVARYHEYVARQ
ncbi:MAG: hypothetical protein ACRD08_10580, partial [Acidimicrobiales bacterium]